MCLLAVYAAFSWLPTMLAASRLSVSVAGTGLTAYNLGGVIGALLCAWTIAHAGSRWPLVLCSIGGAASAVWLMGGDASRHTGWLIVGLGLHAVRQRGAVDDVCALCVHLPTAVRATGTGSALAFGRLGAILSAFAGAIVITTGGATAYLTMLAIAMHIVCVALLVVRRHIPWLSRAAAQPREGEELARTSS